MILLDTHVVVWLLIEPDRLSRSASRRIQREREDGGLGICSVTLFEIAELLRRGRIVVERSMGEFLEEISERFAVKTVTAKAAFASTQLVDPYPRDPMDRLIGAISLSEGFPLVTADERIRNSGQVNTIW